MIYRKLGRTGIEVSIIGQGTGGHDPLGQKSGKSEQEMCDFLKFAFDSGINLFDTSPGYGNGRIETILGKAAKEIGRDKVVLSTKMPVAGGMPGEPLTFMNPKQIEPALDESLKRLQTDYIDMLLLAVADEPEHFNTVINDLIPEFQKLIKKGKIKFLGSTEQTRSDGSHVWLSHALATGVLDVAMVGHNMINQSAQHSVFPLCKENNIGVLNIFTVRNVFCNPTRLKEVIADLSKKNIIKIDDIDLENPLNWLIDDGCLSIIEAAYRYAAYTDSVNAVMCGTIQKNELTENINTISKGPLTDWKIERLKELFGKVAEPIGN